ncbi:MAG: amino acid ABC transporter permease [Acidimicrobiia bacterium]|nr:amino acid ABC transporter permease [Acidimicrobiia bacterium]
MDKNPAKEPASPGPSAVIEFDSHDFPWWLVGMIAIIVGMGAAVVLNPRYNEAFRNIFPWPLIEDVVVDDVAVGSAFVWGRGIVITLVLTLASFVIATVLGLLIGLGRISGLSDADQGNRSVIKSAIRNVSQLYIELIRGIPMLVFIFVVAQVLAPDFADLIHIESRSISPIIRMIAALSLFYAAFIAEVFRAGIQSVPVGQLEAGRAVGLSEGAIMRRVVLPQAIRNMLPALGNDLISLMKDTSLASVLAVREITQMARLYTGSTFRFREGFFVLVVIYVTLTLSLSLLLRWYEKRIAIPGR